MNRYPDQCEHGVVRWVRDCAPGAGEDVRQARRPGTGVRGGRRHGAEQSADEDRDAQADDHMVREKGQNDGQYRRNDAIPYARRLLVGSAAIGGQATHGCQDGDRNDPSFDVILYLQPAAGSEALAVCSGTTSERRRSAWILAKRRRKAREKTDCGPPVSWEGLAHEGTVPVRSTLVSFRQMSHRG